MDAWIDPRGWGDVRTVSFFLLSPSLSFFFSFFLFSFRPVQARIAWHLAQTRGRIDLSMQTSWSWLSSYPWRPQSTNQRSGSKASGNQKGKEASKGKRRGGWGREAQMRWRARARMEEFTSQCRQAHPSITNESKKRNRTLFRLSWKTHSTNTSICRQLLDQEQNVRRARQANGKIGRQFKILCPFLSFSFSLLSSLSAKIGRQGARHYQRQHPHDSSRKA